MRRILGTCGCIFALLAALLIASSCTLIADSLETLFEKDAFTPSEEASSAYAADDPVTGRETADSPVENTEDAEEETFPSASPDEELFASTAPVLTDALNDLEKLLYERLRAAIFEICRGERDNAVIEISAGELGFGRKYTAEELGASAILSDGKIAAEARDALSERELKFSLKRLEEALLITMPAEMFWFDKTEPFRYRSPAIRASGTDEEMRIYVNPESFFEFTCPLVGDYQGAEQNRVDSARLSSDYARIESAARRIVDENADKTDLEKLNAYCDVICALTDYNDAAGAEDRSSAQPWQILYVFDEDPATKVVCEGYAKAFKYLCDLTDFDADISCFLVSGTLDTGDGGYGHMWNGVRMDDGRSYLVDVTNCDKGAIGWPKQLFLAGSADGSVEGGYILTTDSASAHYRYEIYEGTLLTGADMTLAPANYPR